MPRRRSMAASASTMWLTRSRSSVMAVSSGAFAHGFGGAQPSGHDEAVAVEIKIGGPEAVLPARRHEEKAAHGEVGERVLAGREDASQGGGERHRAGSSKGRSKGACHNRASKMSLLRREKNPGFLLK